MNRNLENFTCVRKGQHSSLGVSYTIHKYIAAGVGYCLFTHRFFQSLYSDKQSIPHFLCLYIITLGVGVLQNQIMEIKIGDVVRLKSGGHSMTVSAYPFKTIDGMEHFDKVECQWFNEDGLLKHYVYSVEELDYEV